MDIVDLEINPWVLKYHEACPERSRWGWREYDPELGRWNRPDPIRQNYISSYAYVSNDPVNRYDILGLKTSPDPWQYNWSAEWEAEYGPQNGAPPDASFGGGSGGGGGGSFGTSMSQRHLTNLILNGIILYNSAGMTEILYNGIVCTIYGHYNFNDYSMNFTIYGSRWVVDGWRSANDNKKRGYWLERNMPLATEGDSRLYQMFRGTSDINQNITSFCIGVPALSFGSAAIVYSAAAYGTTTLVTLGNYNAIVSTELYTGYSIASAQLLTYSQATGAAVTAYTVWKGNILSNTYYRTLNFYNFNSGYINNTVRLIDRFSPGTATMPLNGLEFRYWGFWIFMKHAEDNGF